MHTALQLLRGTTGGGPAAGEQPPRRVPGPPVRQGRHHGQQLPRSDSSSEKLKELYDRKLKVNFQQGLDLRLVTRKEARLIVDVKSYNRGFNDRSLYGAWDRPEDYPKVVRGIRLLKEAGAYDIMVYILCGYDTTHDQDLVRWLHLVNLGCKPYVMRYNQRRDDKWLNQFTKYVNGRDYKFFTIDEWRGGVLRKTK